MSLILIEHSLHHILTECEALHSDVEYIRLKLNLLLKHSVVLIFLVD